ncbi:DNA primase [Burkholderia gladioli]|uniref:DNA primase n=1 Tax=Burkholderia gladioli TaxID=28095 RepID=UPI003B50203A
MESWLDAEGFRYKRTRGVRGEQLNIRTCPFCGNDHYKVYANAESARGNCFVCGETFNLYKFIRAGIGASTDKDAIEHIKGFARDLGWRPTKREPASATTHRPAELKLPANLPLPIAGKNLKYLDSRGINAHYAEYFGLRFSMNGRFWFDDINGRRTFQDYSKRVIIPVFDLDGTMVTFQGRDITGASEKRYLFPPGLASTGSHLYNGHNVRGDSHVVMAEGVFDTAAIRIALDGEQALRGVGAIGSFGKHLSSGSDDSQLSKLMTLRDAGLRTVTIMFDGEVPAVDAAVDAALLARSVGLTARVALLPFAHDPNEVPAEVVRQAFWKATTISSTTAAARIKVDARRLYR